MSAYYIVQGPANAVNNGEKYSQRTANADLSAASWAPTVDSADAHTYVCPRAFVPKADGVLVIRALDDTADRNMYVLAGLVYPIALKAINRTGTAAALQIADAVTLLY
jgi:hypothetical protein